MQYACIHFTRVDVYFLELLNYNNSEQEYIFLHNLTMLSLLCSNPEPMAHTKPNYMTICVYALQALTTLDGVDILLAGLADTGSPVGTSGSIHCDGKLE